MSYWSNHPELYDEICLKAYVAAGVVDEEDDEEDTDAALAYARGLPESWKIEEEAVREYWAGFQDGLREWAKYERLEGKK